MEFFYELANTIKKLKKIILRENIVTPLHIAIREHRSMEEIIQIIEEHPDYVKQRDGDYDFPIHLCIKHKFETNKMNSIIKKILEKYPEATVDRDYVNNRIGSNAISLALLLNVDISIIETLLKHDPYQVNNEMTAYRKNEMIFLEGQNNIINFNVIPTLLEYTTPLFYTLRPQEEQLDYNTVLRLMVQENPPTQNDFLPPQTPVNTEFIVRNYAEYAIAAAKDSLDQASRQIEELKTEYESDVKRLSSVFSKSIYGVFDKFSRRFDASEATQQLNAIREKIIKIEGTIPILEDKITTSELLATPEEIANSTEIAERWKLERRQTKNWNERKNFMLFLAGSDYIDYEAEGNPLRREDSEIVKENKQHNLNRESAFSIQGLQGNIASFLGGKKNKKTKSKRKITVKKCKKTKKQKTVCK